MTKRLYVLFILGCFYVQVAESAVENREPASTVTPVTVKALHDELLSKLNTSPEESLKLAKEALNICKSLDHKHCMAQSLNLLGHVKKLMGDYQGALKCLNQALAIGSGVNRGLSLTNIGLIYYYQGDNQKALEYHEKAYQVYDSLKDEPKKAASLTNIGLSYFELADYEKAIAHYLISLGIKEKLNRDIGNVLNNIGNVYKKVGNDSVALKYFSDALQAHQSKGKKREEAYSLTHLGMVYLERGDYTMAVQYHQEALKIREALSDIKGTANSLNNLGNSYLQMGNLEAAEKHFMMSLALNETLNSKKEMATSYLSLGKVYAQYGYSTRAIENLNKVKEIALAGSDIETMVAAQACLANIYQEAGRYEEALEAYNVYMQWKDSLSAARNNKEIFRLQKRHELDRKEKEIALLQKDKALQASELNRVRIIIYGASVAFLFVMILIAIVFRNRARADKAKALLHEKNEQLSRQKILELMKDQQLKSIQENIKGQETEKRRIAKELHDGLGATLSSIKLRLANTGKNLQEDEKQTLLNILDRSCEEVRTISHHLIPPALSVLDFVDLLKNYVDEIAALYNLHISAKFFPEEELNMLREATQTEIYRIVQELLNNVVKHARASKVSLQLLHHEQHINLLMEDNGVGFEYINKNGGIGLLNIRSRVELLQGNFDIDSKQGRGTIVNIDLLDVDKAISK